MKEKKFITNECGISIVQDTLLFLVFISISALILSPSIIQSGMINEQYDYLYEIKAQESLQALLSSNDETFQYQTGLQQIDTIAKEVGINTKQNNSIYRKLSSHFLSKDQYHKSIGQLISEILVTQYEFTVENKTIKLNPFSGNSQDQLYQLIYNKLEQIIPSHIEYHFSAEWYPITGIPLGGNISIGNPIPHHRSTYGAHQTISLPILPCFQFRNSTICLSSTYMKHKMEFLKENVNSIQNLSILFNKEEKDKSPAEYSKNISHNISELLHDFFINGIFTSTNELVVPSIFDILCSHFFSETYFSLSKTEKLIDHKDSFHMLESFFDYQLNNFENDYTDISSFIISEFGTQLKESLKNQLLSTAIEFTVFIKGQLHHLLQPLINNISENITKNLLSNTSLESSLETIFNTCFGQLSLSTASVRLTIWSS